MSLTLLCIHWLCGVVVLAEALNKLERTNPLRPHMRAREAITEWLKATAWLLLALGGATAVTGPFLQLDKPTMGDAAFALGFAVLIVRTRVKEG